MPIAASGSRRPRAPGRSLTADAPPLRTSDFDYTLPPELVAQHPVAERGASRLLVVHRSGTPALEDRRFTDFPSLLAPGDLVVLNTTRVRHARLLGTRPSGAPAEVLLIHPATDGSWIAIGKPGSAMRPGRRIALAPGLEVETLEVLPDGERRIRFVGGDAEEAMRVAGRLPLPPYIAREPEPSDEGRYQTVYAEREGSVAAPTAGLHFTPELLQAVTAAGAAIGRLDLEVGPGTFKPVEVEDFARHPMHPERFEIPEALAEAVRRTRDAGGAVWAVGTTVVRALESAAGEDGVLRAGASETRLMIAPGHRFRVVDRLLTNFHLPRSSLLMLVSAFVAQAHPGDADAGRRILLETYEVAKREGYRFFSFGDAMLIA